MSSRSTNSTDPSLLRRVHENETSAWDQFVDLYGPLIYFWAKRGGLEPHDAADVTQETLAAVVKSIHSFDHHRGQGSLRGWLWTVARNKLQDFHRQAVGDRPEGGTQFLKALQALPDQLSWDQSDSIAQEEMSALFHRALGQVEAEFEPHTWQAFWRVVVEHQSTADVALDLGLSANSVRQAKSRVLRRLREQLSDWPPDDIEAMDR